MGIYICTVGLRAYCTRAAADRQAAKTGEEVKNHALLLLDPEEKEEAAALITALNEMHGGE